MSFWNDQKVEPKRKFRWLLSIQTGHLDPDGKGVQSSIPYWTIKKVNRPSYTVEEATHKFINHTFYFPGRVTYNTINFTIVDTASPDAAETLKQILYASGYALPKNELVSTQSITKDAAVRSLGEVTIELLGGKGVANQSAGKEDLRSVGFATDTGGQVLEKWTLHNAWVKKIEFSELDYEGDELTEITVELRYDYAELNDGDITSAAGTLTVDPTPIIPARAD